RDAGVAALVGLADVADADVRPAAGPALGDRRLSLALLACAPVHGHRRALLGARAARVRVGARVRRRRLAGELTIELAAGAWAVGGAEFALLAGAHRAVAARGGAAEPSAARPAHAARRTVGRGRADDALLAGRSAHGDRGARVRARADVDGHARVG